MDLQQQSLSKPSRKQLAYDGIKEKILSCEFQPGSFINEQILCDELNLSRTPVRDALVRLEKEGLVVIRPKIGTQVTELKLNDINRIYEVRLLLEPYALRRYGAKLDKERLEEFRKLMLDTELAHHDPAYYYDLDDKLHWFIMEAMSNRFLLATYSNIKSLDRRLRVLSGEKVQNRIEDTFKEHVRIIDKCLIEDWEAAANEMTKHLDAARVAAFQLIVDNESDF